MGLKSDLKIKTWHIETTVVAGTLFAVNYFTHRLCSIEIIAAFAVLSNFGHASISDRLAEQEALRDKKTVECYKKLWGYFIAKEACWLLYFFMAHAYSALVGVFLFLLYPAWRSVYRKYCPLGR